MKFVLIPPGEFLMGSSDEQVAAALKVAEEIKADPSTMDRIQKAERPQHKVVITKPFLMSVTEVTIGQFRKCSEAAKCVTEAELYAFGDALGNEVTDKITDDVEFQAAAEREFAHRDDVETGAILVRTNDPSAHFECRKLIPF